jgi:8-oxo-dGTP pyrophosphatase MutT (NUDIX family)
MRLTQQLALWADLLRGYAALGLHYNQDVYNQERYRAIRQVSQEMLAAATATPIETLEPLLAPVLTQLTPFAVGDAAIIDEQGRLLLIQRADNHLWAMPGGAFDMGETPAEGAAREALEETGIHCQPVALVGVFDSRFCGTPSRHHLYQFTFLCKPLDRPAIESPSHGHEVVDKCWFAEHELPANIDPGHITRIPIVFRFWRGEISAYFDQ